MTDYTPLIRALRGGGASLTARDRADLMNDAADAIELLCCRLEEATSMADEFEGQVAQMMEEVRECQEAHAEHVKLITEYLSRVP